MAALMTRLTGPMTRPFESPLLSTSLPLGLADSQTVTPSLRAERSDRTSQSSREVLLGVVDHRVLEVTEQARVLVGMGNQRGTRSKQTAFSKINSVDKSPAYQGF